MDLYACTILDVKKINYYVYMWVLQWMKKKSTSIYDTYMRVLQWMKKNQQIFMRPICGYCNRCKKPTIIYKTYMWVLHI
jgi:thioredoxin-related protein